MIQQALILAAGLGKRMQPITNTIPKPMVEILGQSLITRIVDQAYQAGIKNIVINLFYKAKMLQEHVEEYIRRVHPDIEVRFVIEEELHEVWGSIKKSLPYMGEQPFLLVNGGGYWVDTSSNIITSLYKQWQSSYMNALILLYPKERAMGYEGKGDFALQEGKIIDPKITPEKPWVYIGLQIISPSFLREEPLRKCNVFDIYAKNNYAGIYGAVYDGYWFHIGTPEAIAETESFLKVRFMK